MDVAQKNESTNTQAKLVAELQVRETSLQVDPELHCPFKHGQPAFPGGQGALVVDLLVMVELGGLREKHGTEPICPSVAQGG